VVLSRPIHHAVRANEKRLKLAALMAAQTYLTNHLTWKNRDTHPAILRRSAMRDLCARHGDQGQRLIINLESGA